MEYKHLLLSIEDGIGTVTINRAKVLNTLNSEVFAELYRMFSEIETNPAVRVVILTGSGDKAFVAGVDIGEMKDQTSVSIEKFIKIARMAGEKIYSLNLPVIAAINGFAFGGGNELALCCDIRIASENARFGQQEINLAIVPGGGAMQRLPRLIGMARAKEIIFTGDMFDAQTALQIGMINKVVPLASLIPEARALAQKLLSKSSVALAYAKKSINSGVSMSLASAMDMDECYFARCFGSEDQKEGMKAFMEKRKPQFKNQ
jgi:enoyl-CoA hydratase